MRNSSGPIAPSSSLQGGFTYLTLLIAIAIIGLVTVATAQFGAILQQRFAEEELLAIGTEFQTALISYANATPAGLSPYPSSLKDLIKDPRYPAVLRRHLRKIYIDPLTGIAEWGTVSSIDGRGIVGLYSFSNRVPIKVGNFEPRFESFNGKTSYRDWLFTGSNYSSK